MSGFLFQAGLVVFLIFMLEVFFKIIVAGEGKQRRLAGFAAMATAAVLAAVLVLPVGQGDGRVDPDDPDYGNAQVQRRETGEEYAQMLLSRGKEEFNAGAYEEAMRTFDLALSISPNLQEAKEQKQLAQQRLDALSGEPAASGGARDQSRAGVGRKDFGAGPLQIAVLQYKFTSTVSSAYGFDYSTGEGHGRYLWLYVSAVNRGTTPVPAGPDDFMISTADGYRATRSEATFSQKYFRPVLLEPGGSNNGWIIFYVPPGTLYTLGYYSEHSRVEKTLALQPG